ncbi:Acylphosphatase-like domain-containing protein [Fimicolochytrium jonesii]|uniref:Acylphosphatase-like domain-containing protein n=1 Tax=Fimicolochytrium jonesii TaxID=1396493 RepID=UPI0022FEC6EC|nr:Acylphosphatase-like domain-containing protein [Fimicolochytrium jonesii]KAI8819979.1 Acylphosphatase-like domain-containing protein [Fimicolochytrium jonesii]
MSDRTPSPTQTNGTPPASPGNEKIRQLVYVSQASHGLTSADMADILVEARTRNEVCNISGMLLMNNGQFMQCVEGPSGAVEELIDGIGRDERHCFMSILLDHFIETRDFDCWLMGFKDLSSNKHFANNDDVMDSAFLSEMSHPSRAVALLSSFAKL